MSLKNKDMKGPIWLVERKCGVCGKLIFPTYGWVYKKLSKKNRMEWYCSYKCWREAGGGK